MFTHPFSSSAKYPQEVDSRTVQDRKKFGRESQNYNDKKAEIKDGHAYLAWKEQKDYHKGKRAEGSSSNVDPCVASRGNEKGWSRMIKKGIRRRRRSHRTRKSWVKASAEPAEQEYVAPDQNEPRDGKKD
ncbi:hypothetical protein Bca52824_037257 [Brassica carinata]|uniref:Uncharacterized protein n=1 Tax=Brassica carinata TaxID=52824 RepID=A0A8X7S6E5_BRACI|nr:hypothetical protein Bca52824_037257 [Brassica carinata]